MAAVNAGDLMGVVVEVSTLGFNVEDEDIFCMIPFSVFLRIMSSTNAGYQRSVLDELSTLGIYAEDPTLPEEKKIYDVDKTKIPSVADIDITTIVWTAASYSPPFQPFVLHQMVIPSSPFPLNFFDLW